MFTGWARVATIGAATMMLFSALAFVPKWAAIGGWGGATNSALAADIGEDALADLASRSPGARLSGIATLKEGIPRLLAARAHADEPQQRALGKVFDAPALAEVMFGPKSLADGPFSFGAPTTADLPTDVVPIGGVTSGLVPGGRLPGAGSVFVPGGGGGGINDGGGTGSTPPVIFPPVGAVPEPEAWALMILGFGMVGVGLRTRRRKVWLSHQT